MVWLERVGVALGVVILAAAAGAVASYLAYRHDVRIDTAKGIDEAGYLKVGGIDQWVQIRGDDRDNPVLLWLNGGPGFSTIPSTFGFREWEKRFTVAMCDQRGEGKTFARSGTSVKDTMTIDQMTRDGIEVVYFDSIEAPSKEFAVLDGAGHNAIFGDREAFLNALDKRARPFALSIDPARWALAVMRYTVTRGERWQSG